MPRKKYIFKKFPKGLIVLLFSVLAFPALMKGQTTQDSLPSKATLTQCITYALANQALVRQSLLDEDITRKGIRIALSGWYPQLEFDAGLQHYLKVPVASYPNLSDPSGPPLKYPASSINGSSGIFSFNQTLYSSNLFFAARTASELRNQATENTINSKIDT
jgi:outer membrane protein TolC